MGSRNGSRNGARLSGGPSLYAAASHRHGRGVFAGRRFRKGEILERCPILPITAKERRALERTRLSAYMYERDAGAAAIALGFGSLYNHSFDANAECELLVNEGTAVFRALRAIAPGEEITIRYTDESHLWFVPRESNGHVAR
jgi:SET domain-containing protein